MWAILIAAVIVCLITAFLLIRLLKSKISGLQRDMMILVEKIVQLGKLYDAERKIIEFRMRDEKIKKQRISKEKEK